MPSSPPTNGGPTPDLLARLVHLIVAEAYEANCEEIQIDCGDNAGTMHYLRGHERLPRDSIPVRLFAAVKRDIARLCGVDENVAEASYLAAVSEQRPDIQVVVAFAESSLRLRLMSQA